MSDPLQQVGRIAFRVEGDNWVAYWAPAATMEGALVLGSIRMSIVTRSDALKHHFMQLMRDSFALAAREALGADPSFGEPAPGPEHERAGHG